MTDPVTQRIRVTHLEWWLIIVVGAVVSLGGEAFLGFTLAFAPGWANDWPLGLTIYSVWSTGMSVMCFLLLMTAAIAMGAIVGAVVGNWLWGLIFSPGDGSESNGAFR